MNKKLIIALLAIALLAALFIYREYNRTSEDLHDARADYSITAKELIASFEKDSASSSRKYVNKVIAVSGNVKSIDPEGNPVVISLGEGNSMSSVQCSMDSAYAVEYAKIREGDAITLKGAYIGYRTEDFFDSLFTDVQLNRCVVEKK